MDKTNVSADEVTLAARVTAEDQQIADANTMSKQRTVRLGQAQRTGSGLGVRELCSSGELSRRNGKGKSWILGHFWETLSIR